MADKTYIITFKLTELAASHYYQVVEVGASNIGLAINRAWAIVKKRPAVKGRRISNAQITITQSKEYNDD